MNNNTAQVAINDSLTSYFRRVVLLSGASKLPCVITYLADHKFFGSGAFLETIVNGGELPPSMLANVAKMIDSELNAEFSDEEAIAFGDHERTLAATFSEMYYLNAVTTFIGCNSDEIASLLMVIDFTAVVSPIHKGVKISDMSLGINALPDAQKKRLTIYEVLAGTYVDMHDAIDAGIADIA